MSVGIAYYSGRQSCAKKQRVMERAAANDDVKLPPGRILSLDLGEKRIGVAVCDPSQTVARPLRVIGRTSRQSDFDALAGIVAQEGVNSLLVGVPVQPDGEEGSLAAWIKDYALELSRYLALPLCFYDESFTTKRAGDSLRGRGVRAKEQRGRVDAVAAAILLQDYLDARAK